MSSQLLTSINGAPAGFLRIDSVSKSFKRHTVARQTYSTVKSSLIARLFGKGRKREKVEALKNFSATVPPGSALGVIGRNGSGKSTLLKLIAGIYRPDTGKVSVHGRVSALIELGAGFHPDFTGRENVYLGGVMYGLTRKEVAKRFDEIVSFAELEDFIDDPVRTYSSGMYMRLGFSLAIHTDPDILLVDEVLAVGDAGFVGKCHERISELKRRGKTLVFVTHDLDSVARWCDEAIWLDKGVMRERGEPRFVIDQYLQSVEEHEEKQISEENTSLLAEVAEVIQEEPIEEEQKDRNRWGNRDVEITSVKLIKGANEESWVVHSDDRIRVEVEYVIKRPVEDLVFGVGLIRADGLQIFGTNTQIERIDIDVPSEVPPTGIPGKYAIEFERLGLIDGHYFIDVAAHRVDGLPFDYHHLLYRFSVHGSARYHGIFQPIHHWDVGESVKLRAALGSQR